MMRKNLMTICVLCLSMMFLLGACAEDEKDFTGTIYGLITDAADANKAIAGATVTITPGGKRTTTGSDGRYEFKDLEVGSYTLQVTAAGYVTDRFTVSVVAGEKNEGDLQLRKETAQTDLELSRSNLNFGSNLNEMSIELKNKGNKATAWEAISEASWLSVAPLQGTLEAGKQEVLVVKVNRKLISSQSNTILKITAGGTSYPVTVSILPEGETSELSFIPEEADFGVSRKEMTLSVNNLKESGSISWTIKAPENGALTVFPLHGTTQAGKTTSIKVDLDRSKMQESFRETLELTANGIVYTVLLSATYTENENPDAPDDPDTPDNPDDPDNNNPVDPGDTDIPLPGVIAISPFDNLDATVTKMTRSTTGKVEVEFKMQNNTGNKIDLRLTTSSYTSNTYAYDNIGNQYKITQIELGNSTSSYSPVSIAIPDQVIVKGKLVIEGVDASASELVNITVSTGLNGQSDFVIRNLNIGEGTEKPVESLNQAFFQTPFDDLEAVVTNVKRNQSNGKTEIAFKLTNNGSKARELRLTTTGYTSNTYVYDNEGNQYAISSVTLGQSSSSYSPVTGTLPSKVSIVGKFVINDVALSATTFTNITVSTGLNGQDDYIIKNLTIR